MDSVEPIPPQDLDAEQALLGAMLLGASTQQAAEAGVRPTDFYRDAHAWIAAACFALVERADAIDMVTVADELRRQDRLDAIGGFDYLDRLVRATPYSANAGQYIEIVLEKARLRQVMVTAQRLAQRAMEPGAQAELLAGEMERASGSILRQRGARFDSSPGAAIDSWLTGAALLEQRFSTGYTSLDKLLGGGFWWPGLYLIEAREKRGKSALAMNIVNSIIDQGGKVGYLAREMSKGATMCRLIGIRGSIPQVALYDGLPRVPEYRLNAEHAIRELRDQDAIHIVDVADIDSSMAASAMAIRHFAEIGCGFVVVDNFNNIYAPGEGYERHNRVAEDLNDLSKSLKLPFLVLCQTSERRGGIQHTQTLQQDCIAHMGLIREVGSATAVIQVKCGRESSEGRIELSGDPKTYEWHEVGDYRPDRDASPSDYDDPYYE